MSRTFDIVIYGATGFTGHLCADYFDSIDTKINWAIAGRNLEKLEAIAANLDKKVEILVADPGDPHSLDLLTSSAKVVLSTAGPFHRCGSELVASCVKNSTHYVDITGETFWIKELIEKHHEEASRKGVRIIPSCGFDSIPSDLGTYFGIRNIGKPVKKIESFHSWKGEASGGTLETVFSMGETVSKPDLSNPFLLNPEGSFSDEQRTRSADQIAVSRNEALGAWSGPFIMAPVNTRIVRRSEALLSLRQEPYGPNFIYQEHGFFKGRLPAYLSLISMALFGLVLMTPLKRIIRPLLRKPGEGPSKTVQKSGWFECKFLAETEDGEKYIFGIKGEGDPGYRVTSKLVSEAAICIVENLDQLPGGSAYGGLLTSASGLGDVLIERLSKADINFSKPFKIDS